MPEHRPPHRGCRKGYGHPHPSQTPLGTNAMGLCSHSATHFGTGHPEPPMETPRVTHPHCRTAPGFVGQPVEPRGWDRRRGALQGCGDARYRGGGYRGHGSVSSLRRPRAWPRSRRHGRGHKLCMFAHGRVYLPIRPERCGGDAPPARGSAARRDGGARRGRGPGARPGGGWTVLGPRREEAVGQAGDRAPHRQRGRTDERTDGRTNGRTDEWTDG